MLTLTLIALAFVGMLIAARPVFTCHDSRYPLDSRYPHGWQGALRFAVYFPMAGVVLRASFNRAPIAGRGGNDCDGIDTARHTNISPRWARWFSYFSYRSAFGRYIRHLVIGGMYLSYLPNSRPHDLRWAVL